MEDWKERVALARQAQVRNPHRTLDRHVQRLGEGGSLALEIGAQHADRHDVDQRGHPRDDPRAGGAVAKEVARHGLAHHLGLASLHLDGPALLEAAAHGGMVTLDSGIDDRDADPFPGRSAEGPLAIDRLERGKAD